MNNADIKTLLTSRTPRARLEAHKEYWGDTPHPEIQGHLETVERLLASKPASSKAILILAKLDSLRLLKGWNTDPDTIRGERQLQGASAGGKAKAYWSHRKAELQAAVDAEHRKNPKLGIKELRKRVAEQDGYPSESTLKRHTVNPRTK
ncbi:hypothetical protein GH984_03700 [Spiribacter sp. C176]|uniref:Uncharacterized protein n=1 Tax=Spiribacter salilacus TaxID=2664894 RepID=A0A6N7QQ26_9GAMM|nr:hypothetical protein [Spiribacter salilacus]MRH77800.1 hypothetical protein [Spiribacter salilacus]